MTLAEGIAQLQGLADLDIAALFAQEQDEGRRQPATPIAPTPSATPEPQPQADQNELRLSEVQGVVRQAPPQEAPTPVPGGRLLLVPGDMEIVWGGCASDNTCHWYNFYWAPTREVVMQHGESALKVQHEICHAHQHWSINRGAPLAPSEYDLSPWYGTAEGRSFMSAVAGLSWPWSHSAVNGIEDFAWTCAYFFQDPAYLLQVSPERYRWALANLSY